MAGDPRDDFLALVASIREGLTARGGASTWSAGPDRRISGWLIDEDHRHDEEMDGNYWKEVVTIRARIFGIDGLIWFYDEWRNEGSNYSGVEVTKRLAASDPRELVGTKGAPFSEWKSILQRFKYRVL